MVKLVALCHDNRNNDPRFLSTVTLKLYFSSLLSCHVSFMTMIICPVFYEILIYQYLVNLTCLMCAALRMRSRLRCLRMDSACRHAFEAHFAQNGASASPPSLFFRSAFLYSFSHFSQQPPFDHVNYSPHNLWLFLAYSLTSIFSNYLGTDTSNRVL